MSVKVHEAFSLDSFMDRLLWFDDFHGDQLQDEWREGGTGSAAVVDAQTGGIVRLTTGAITNNEYNIDWNDIRTLLVSKKVSMEVRVKLTQTANTRLLLRLHDEWVTEEGINFRYDSSENVNWRIQASNAGVTTTFDSGVATDTDYHIFRIEAFPTGEVHFYIDGVECANSPITTNIPDEHLQPFLLVRTLENLAKSADIDYVYIRQER